MRTSKSLVIAALFLALASPGAAHAFFDVRSIENEIRALLTQLAGLQRQLAELQAQRRAGVVSQLAATPTSGSAPLSVTFSTRITGRNASSVSYALDYGDGIREAPTSCYAPLDVCVQPGANTHTYTRDGSYAAQLLRIEGGNEEALERAHIRVGASAPRCPVASCRAPACPFGERYVSEAPVYGPDGCQVNACAGHCESGDSSSVSILSFAGPTSLVAGEEGTWVVHASDSLRGQLSYDIRWGDATLSQITNATATSITLDTQEAVARHAYALSGTYLVTVIARNQAGKTATASATVVVTKTGAKCAEGGTSYGEGESRSCITQGDRPMCVNDGAFFCRGGAWRYEKASAAPAYYTSPSCLPGYLWCPTGLGAYRCTLSLSGSCPAVY